MSHFKRNLSAITLSLLITVSLQTSDFYENIKDRVEHEENKNYEFYEDVPSVDGKQNDKSPDLPKTGPNNRIDAATTSTPLEQRERPPPDHRDLSIEKDSIDAGTIAFIVIAMIVLLAVIIVGTVATLLKWRRQKTPRAAKNTPRSARNTPPVRSVVAKTKMDEKKKKTSDEGKGSTETKTTPPTVEAPSPETNTGTVTTPVERSGEKKSDDYDRARSMLTVYEPSPPLDPYKPHIASAAEVKLRGKLRVTPTADLDKPHELIDEETVNLDKISFDSKDNEAHEIGTDYETIGFADTGTTSMKSRRKQKKKAKNAGEVDQNTRRHAVGAHIRQLIKSSEK